MQAAEHEWLPQCLPHQWLHPLLFPTHQVMHLLANPPPERPTGGDAMDEDEEEEGRVAVPLERQVVAQVVDALFDRWACGQGLGLRAAAMVNMGKAAVGSARLIDLTFRILHHNPTLCFTLRRVPMLSDWPLLLSWAASGRAESHFGEAGVTNLLHLMRDALAKATGGLLLGGAPTGEARRAGQRDRQQAQVGVREVEGW